MCFKYYSIHQYLSPYEFVTYNATWLVWYYTTALPFQTAKKSTSSLDHRFPHSQALPTGLNLLKNKVNATTPLLGHENCILIFLHTHCWYWPYHYYHPCNQSTATSGPISIQLEPISWLNKDMVSASCH